MPQSGGKTDINDLLRKAGIDDATVEAVVDIDALMQHWRRRVQKRELGSRALVELNVGLDLPQLDVLLAIARPEFGEGQGETMIATVAERLSIDPSRASRVVSEMVELGYARRAVSQADARRTIIELTDAGTAVIEAVRAYKFLIMGDFLSRWPADEVAAFVPMLLKFAEWQTHTDVGAEKFADDIALLARQIAAARRQTEPA